MALARRSDPLFLQTHGLDKVSHPVLSRLPHIFRLPWDLDVQGASP